MPILLAVGGGGLLLYQLRRSWKQARYAIPAKGRSPIHERKSSTFRA
ncbi:MAG UNVERIFIED_CONTAM: hypothetical protein LVT10_19145 [Anaerolineae bacterium]